MRALFCKDTLLRPFRSMRGDPDRWISRLVFLLGPWAALWTVSYTHLTLPTTVIV